MWKKFNRLETAGIHTVTKIKMLVKEYQADIIYAKQIWPSHAKFTRHMCRFPECRKDCKL